VEDEVVPNLYLCFEKVDLGGKPTKRGGERVALSL
jgi:hypothetical protein